MARNTNKVATSNANETNNAVATASEKLQNNNEMRKKLLFVEGNRQNIDKSNVLDCFNKMKAHGFLPSMPIEYVDMKQAAKHLNGRKLYEIILKRKNGNGDAIPSNFETEIKYVKPKDYKNYEGVTIDGQHRTLALMFEGLKDVKPSYKEVDIPLEMDILSYVALRNNGKSWNNVDFYKSGIETGNVHIDYMLNKCKEGHTPAFIFSIYSLPTTSLTPTQIKSIQLGYKSADDYGKLQLNQNSQEMGDKVMESIQKNPILTLDKLNGRFGNGLKKFYKKHKDVNAVIEVINALNKDLWNTHFFKGEGKSLEIKGYEEAFESIYNQCKEESEVA